MVSFTPFQYRFLIAMLVITTACNIITIGRNWGYW